MECWCKLTSDLCVKRGAIIAICYRNVVLFLFPLSESIEKLDQRVPDLDEPPIRFDDDDEISPEEAQMVSLMLLVNKILQHREEVKVSLHWV